MLSDRECTPANAAATPTHFPRQATATRAALTWKIGGVLIALGLLLASCGGDASERVAGSAAMGGALGIPAGPVGIAIGASVGAAAGAFVPKDLLEGSSQESGR
jgi:hypothetical protein